MRNFWLVRLCGLPMPDAARQNSLDGEAHDELPEIENDEPGIACSQRL